MGEYTTEIAAGAAALALLGLLVIVVLAFRVRRLRRDQTAVLGSSGSDDLVTYVTKLERRIDELAALLSSGSERLDDRMGTVEGRLDSAVAHVGVVHYDAYNELSGRQSSSVAFLDASETGVVLSSILHRDSARLYAKPVRRGTPDLDLSPEEQQAVREALTPTAGAPDPSK
ncbi:MAG: DUF4446 family protein [Solirubrobacterales bacterium]